MEFGQIKDNFLILHLRNISRLCNFQLFVHNHLLHVYLSHCDENGESFAMIPLGRMLRNLEQCH